MTTSRPSDPPTLDEMLELAERVIAARVGEVDRLLPAAYVYSRLRGVQVIGFAAHEGPQHAAALRRACRDARAELVVTWAETWWAKPLHERDPRLARILRGELRVRDLPPADREDGALVYAESVARLRAVRLYTVATTDGRRRLVPDPRGTLRVKGSEPPPPDWFRIHFYPLLPSNALAEAAMARLGGGR